MARVGVTRSSSRGRKRFTEFNDQILSFRGKIRGDFREFQESLANEAQKLLRTRTPRKSGRAADNWIIYGLKSKHIGRVLAVGNVAWRGFGPYPKGHSNDSGTVPWIFRLEHGDSTQAPKGMARRTARELRSRFWGKR